MMQPAMSQPCPELELTRSLGARHGEILTPEALGFLAELIDHFTPRLKDLLAERKKRQLSLDEGALHGPPLTVFRLNASSEILDEFSEGADVALRVRHQQPADDTHLSLMASPRQPELAALVDEKETPLDSHVDD